MINMIIVPKPPEKISSIHIQNRIYIIDTIRFSSSVCLFECFLSQCSLNRVQWKRHSRNTLLYGDLIVDLSSCAYKNCRSRETFSVRDHTPSRIEEFAEHAVYENRFRSGLGPHCCFGSVWCCRWNIAPLW